MKDEVQESDWRRPPPPMGAKVREVVLRGFFADFEVREMRDVREVIEMTE